MCNKHNVLMMYTSYADQIMVIISHIKQLSFFFLLVKCLGSTLLHNPLLIVVITKLCNKHQIDSSDPP